MVKQMGAKAPDTAAIRGAPAFKSALFLTIAGA
jgi:hypothetical protein